MARPKTTFDPGDLIVITNRTDMHYGMAGKISPSFMIVWDDPLFDPVELGAKHGVVSHAKSQIAVEAVRDFGITKEGIALRPDQRVIIKGGQYVGLVGKVKLVYFGARRCLVTITETTPPQNVEVKLVDVALYSDETSDIVNKRIEAICKARLGGSLNNLVEAMAAATKSPYVDQNAGLPRMVTSLVDATTRMERQIAVLWKTVELHANVSDDDVKATRQSSKMAYQMVYSMPPWFHMGGRGW